MTYFLLWTYGEEQLKLFLNYLNKFNPNLKSPYKTSQNSVNFLDLSLNLKDSEIFTDLYIKVSDGHQLLHYK